MPLSHLLLLQLSAYVGLVVSCRYASFQMALAAGPAIAIMSLGSGSTTEAAMKLAWVWAGLSLVMTFRALSIWAPYKLKLLPFDRLFQHQSGSARGLGQEKAE